MLSLLASLILCPLTFAADAPPPPKVEGVTYLQWGLDLTEGSNNANAFDITRVYFGVRQDVGEHLMSRVTLDVGRGADAGKQWAYLKYAYAEWKDPAPGIKIQAGAIPTPYVGYAENFWGHRWVTKSFADEYKLMSSADFGIGVDGNHGKGLVDWRAVVINGEGYSSPEIDATKTIQARVSVDPLAAGGKMNLSITGVGSYSTASPDVDAETEGDQEGDPALLFAGALGFKMDYVVLWAEYDSRTIGEVKTGGYSATLMPRIPEVGSLYVRYDHFDPDADTEDDATDRLMLGASHDFYKKVSMGVHYDRKTAEATPDTPSHGVFLKGQIGF